MHRIHSSAVKGTIDPDIKIYSGIKNGKILKDHSWLLNL